MYRFYGAEISYFSAKVRPALRRKGVHFAEILPTPEAYRKVILPRTGLAFIPVLVTPEDETWQDTSDILDALPPRVNVIVLPVGSPPRLKYNDFSHSDELITQAYAATAGLLDAAPARGRRGPKAPPAPLGPDPTSTGAAPSDGAAASPDSDG